MTLRKNSDSRTRCRLKVVRANTEDTAILTPSNKEADMSVHLLPDALLSRTALETLTTQMPNPMPHLEIEMKVALKNKAEGKAIRKRLAKKAGFVFDKCTFIVDFVEPSKSVTSRVRFETLLRGDQEGETAIQCYIGKKCHPIEGELEQFVRQEQEPDVPVETGVGMLVQALLANRGKPIPYYTKKRRYMKGALGKHKTSIAFDKPKGLLKKFGKRFMEVEIQLPLSSSKNEIEAVVKDIREFLIQLLGEDRKPELSYRRMVKGTWREWKAL